MKKNSPQKENKTYKQSTHGLKHDEMNNTQSPWLKKSSTLEYANSIPPNLEKSGIVQDEYNENQQEDKKKNPEINKLQTEDSKQIENQIKNENKILNVQNENKKMENLYSNLINFKNDYYIQDNSSMKFNFENKLSKQEENVISINEKTQISINNQKEGEREINTDSNIIENNAQVNSMNYSIDKRNVKEDNIKAKSLLEKINSFKIFVESIEKLTKNSEGNNSINNPFFGKLLDQLSIPITEIFQKIKEFQNKNEFNIVQKLEKSINLNKNIIDPLLHEEKKIVKRLQEPLKEQNKLIYKGKQINNLEDLLDILPDLSMKEDILDYKSPLGEYKFRIIKIGNSNKERPNQILQFNNSQNNEMNFDDKLKLLDEENFNLFIEKLTKVEESTIHDLAHIREVSKMNFFNRNDNEIYDQICNSIKKLKRRNKIQNPKPKTGNNFNKKDTCNVCNKFCDISINHFISINNGICHSQCAPNVLKKMNANEKIQWIKLNQNILFESIQGNKFLFNSIIDYL